MHVSFLDREEMKAIDDLKAYYGGPARIAETIAEKRKYETRKAIIGEKGFGRYGEEAEEFAAAFPKVEDYIEQNNIEFTKPGIVTTQVSGWQGCPVTHNGMKRVAEKGDVLLPREMISVMALTDDYVYNGDLITTLFMCENVMKAKFCVASLVGTPLPAGRFDTIYGATGMKMDTIDNGDGLRQLQLKNQGTAFGNLAGVEVANNDHLVYLDSITRTALETGADFFLNPSWSTIVAACYWGRDIPNVRFKISMLLATQNTMQLRMLINIMKEYRRDDGTTPIYEINLGNAMNADTFMKSRDVLGENGLSQISTAAHIRINPDLGVEGFNWFDSAVKVLDRGYDMTIKYESDGECRPYDTMEAYFISKEEREEKAGLIGDVIYHKTLRCDLDAKAFMKMGHDAIFAGVSHR